MFPAEWYHVFTCKGRKAACHGATATAVEAAQVNPAAQLFPPSDLWMPDGPLLRPDVHP